MVYTVGKNCGNISWYFAGRGEYTDLCLCYVMHSYLNDLNIFRSVPTTSFEVIM